jgi:hypothetical protein
VPKSLKIDGMTYVATGAIWPDGMSPTIEYKGNTGESVYMKLEKNPTAPRFPDLRQVSKPSEPVRLS